jgi:hypothetical protein
MTLKKTKPSGVGKLHLGRQHNLGQSSMRSENATKTCIQTTTSASQNGKIDLSNFQPNIAQAKHFFNELAPSSKLTLQTFSDRAKNPALTRVFHGTFDQHADELTRLSLAGAGIFVMVNEGDGAIHGDSKTCRTNRNVVRIRAVFCDLDGAPLEPILMAPMAPQIIVESSPGRWHAYWLTSDTSLSEFKNIQLALAKKYDGDPSVCDLARVMRVPGFYHRKGEPFMTRLVKPASTVST